MNNIPVLGYILTLYQRATAQKALTPAERAFLKSIEGLLLGAVASVALQLPTIFSTHHYNVLLTVVLALINAVLLALSKLYTAHGDTIVGEVLARIEAEIAAKEQLPPLTQ